MSLNLTSTIMIWFNLTLLLCVWVGGGSCPPVGQSTIQNITAPSNALRIQPRELTSCLTPVEGNSDLYGIGIRVGIYLQLFSTLVANHYLPEVIKALYCPLLRAGHF